MMRHLFYYQAKTNRVRHDTQKNTRLSSEKEYLKKINSKKKQNARSEIYTIDSPSGSTVNILFKEIEKPGHYMNPNKINLEKRRKTIQNYLCMTKNN